VGSCNDVVGRRWEPANSHQLYSFSQLLKHYIQAFELKFQNHNAIYQKKKHNFPKL